MIKKPVLLANLVALSLILFLLESALPLPLFAPGAKLGIAQVATVFTLYYFSAKDAFTVLLTRSALSAMFFGGPTIFLYSAAGGIFSLLMMTLLKKSGKFSIYGVSAAGGSCHNLAQLVVAYFVLNTDAFFYYASALCPIGIATGLIIGYVAGEILRRMRRVKVEHEKNAQPK